MMSTGAGSAIYNIPVFHIEVGKQPLAEPAASINTVLTEEK